MRVCPGGTLCYTGETIELNIDAFSWADSIWGIINRMQSQFSSRLGFILVSAGCAIGLGNVWRFPYITGRYGGAMFVLFYLLFLAILGLPIMLCELAVGRGSRKSIASSFDVLEPKGTRWHLYKYGAIAGNMLLMMFYTTISGWLAYYFLHMASGTFNGLSVQSVNDVFNQLLASPLTMAGYMIFVVVSCFGVCYMGVQKGVERISKTMMICLLALMLALVVNSLSLPGAGEGMTYYLKPDWQRFIAYGPQEVIFAAMGQAFFTLSLGIGSLAIFGSYIGKEKSLLGESLWIILLDTFVALMSGCIIFPACFSYGIDPGSGPNLLFLSLPNVFIHMPSGQVWGTLFFLFMIFAAFSSVIAVFENITSCFCELLNVERKKAIRWLAPLMILLSMPCVLSFNVLSGIHPLGPGTGILDLEDFLVSSNLLPAGSIIYVAFCTRNSGWGWDNFYQEVNTGAGIRFPAWVKKYMTYWLPLLILYIFAAGYYGMLAG